MLHTPRLQSAGNSIVVLSIILLLGVLSMAYGFFRREMHWIDLGVVLTIAAGFTVMIQTLLPHQTSKRGPGTRAMR